MGRRKSAEGARMLPCSAGLWPAENENVRQARSHICRNGGRDLWGSGTMRALPGHMAVMAKWQWVGGLLLAALLVSGAALRPALAEVALIYGFDGKFDKSFNESAFRGVLRARAAFEMPIVEFEIDGPESLGPVFDAALAKGPDLIVTIGFFWTDLVAVGAAGHPDRRFAIVDGVVDAPNVQSFVFAEEEASFLAGVMAGLSTETGVAGFIGGIPTQPITRFLAGYRAGVMYANPAATVLVDYMPSGEAPFADPFTAWSLARDQIDRDADILYAPAGQSGLGVYQAARDRGVLAIGVDSNQNFLHPGTMLTSMIKNVDEAVFRAVSDLVDGTWQAGVTRLGLAEGGVAVAYDAFNADLVDDTVRARVERARAGIVAGTLTVPSEPVEARRR